MRYPQGKTPLTVRMDRYLDEFCPWVGREPKYIPIHPKEYMQLLESAKFSGVYRGLQILPLGVRI